MIVLIPAYEPDDRLVHLVELLDKAHVVDAVIVVDDGSGPVFADVFAQTREAGAIVIAHEENQGKGFALKRGFAYIEQRFPDHDVICADCDGQHSVEGIDRVATALRSHPETMVLGTRQFTGEVPAASRIGNTLTRVLFARSTGTHIFDTQTGLRGYPAAMLPWLQRVDGNRFEYELNLLLHAAAEGIAVLEIPIETIYLDGNSSTHFRPIVDSIRVYAPLAKFSLSSLAGFAVDFVLLLVLHGITGNLATSVVGARVVSSTTNFTINRWIVFGDRRGRSLRSSAARYFALVAAILAANYGLMHLLHITARLPLVLAKIITETTLFFGSYQAQKRIVFGRRVVPVVSDGNA